MFDDSLSQSAIGLIFFAEMLFVCARMDRRRVELSFYKVRLEHLLVLYAGRFHFDRYLTCSARTGTVYGSGLVSIHRVVHRLIEISVPVVYVIQIVCDVKELLKRKYSTMRIREVRLFFKVL